MVRSFRAYRSMITHAKSPQERKEIYRLHEKDVKKRLKEEYENKPTVIEKKFAKVMEQRRTYHPIIKSSSQRATVNLGSGEIAEYKNRFFKE